MFLPGYEQGCVSGEAECSMDDALVKMAAFLFQLKLEMHSP